MLNTLSQLLVGAAVIFACVVVQAALVAVAFARLRQLKHNASDHVSILRVSLVVGAMALWLMVVHATAIGAWAVTFGMVGVFSDWDTSVYFSAVAFTTLGFGDVLLPDRWRQLAGLCAAHGLLVFGVSSAALVEVFRQALDPKA